MHEGQGPGLALRHIGETGVMQFSADPMYVQME
jgi:hypothetical protein